MMWVSREPVATRSSSSGLQEMALILLVWKAHLEVLTVLVSRSYRMILPITSPTASSLWDGAIDMHDGVARSGSGSLYSSDKSSEL